jgi:hypothetical protein
MSKTPEQLAYPAVVLLIDRQENRRFEAVAIGPGEDCHLDRDVAPCCYLGQHGRPRYRIDGVERSDFDPTIPDDLKATGWFWHGSFLTQYDRGVAIMVGMPLPSLDDVWKQARKLDAAHADLVAARDAEAQRKAERKPKAQKAEKKPTTPPKEAPKARQAAPPLAPLRPKAPEVVVVALPTAIEQLALF